MEKTRGFEIVRDDCRKFTNQTINLPLRGSVDSAGYDFFSNEEKELQPMDYHVFWMDIKSYMLKGEYLDINVRSSIGIKKGLMLRNTIGIVDKDYYSNPSNDGNIGICLVNLSKDVVKIEKDERIAQGIFKNFLVSDNCNSDETRLGGIGSTNK